VEKAAQQGLPRGGKTTPAVDLFTEILNSSQSRSHTGAKEIDGRILLFLHIILLFKYCTEMKITLLRGHLAASSRSYSQSYPQFLWANSFLLSSNQLRKYANFFVEH